MIVSLVDNTTQKKNAVQFVCEKSDDLYVCVHEKNWNFEYVCVKSDDLNVRLCVCLSVKKRTIWMCVYVKKKKLIFCAYVSVCMRVCVKIDNFCVCVCVCV